MKSQVQKFYRQLHEMPEPGFREKRTSACLAGILRREGFQVTEGIAGTTGVAGTLRGARPGRTVVLRADMDALPFSDEAGSVILRHACGHDANSAMVLACGAALAADGLPGGELRLLFQPAEELLLGAKAMIRGGAVEGADAIVGIHLRPAGEAGLHQATPALCHGACGLLEFDILGKCAHGGRPHLGVNAIDAAVLAVGAVNAIRQDPQSGGSAKATCLRSFGAAANCIPDRVRLCLDLRARNDCAMDRLAEQAKRAVLSGAAAAGAQASCLREDYTAAADYDSGLVEEARRAIEEVLGRALPPIPTPGSEDFHFYRSLAGVPSVYIGLGADMRQGLHAPDMAFDLDALEDGVQILTALVRRLLPPA